jgi:uncharacterized protein YhaN
MGAADRELGYFSAGTEDGAYLSLRLALADLIYKKESAPLIFDDVFVRLDDDRLLSVRDVLRSVACRRQVIVFTCHERESRILADGVDSISGI